MNTFRNTKSDHYRRHKLCRTTMSSIKLRRLFWTPESGVAYARIVCESILNMTFNIALKTKILKQLGLKSEYKDQFPLSTY